MTNRAHLSTVPAPTARALAAATPASRERTVDLVRIVSIAVVVLGHWLMAVIEHDADGFSADSVLARVPALQLATWVLQVMPLFFVVGGFANLRSFEALRRDGQGALAFWDRGVRRLLRPVAILLTVWLPLAVVLDGFVVDEVLAPATRVVVQPLWFVGVYLVVAACAPAMVALHRRHGAAVLFGLAATVVALDVLRFGAGATTLAYLNVVVVWLLAHQVGFFWADGRLARLPRALLVAGVAVSVAVLAVLTTAGPYPVSMVGLPGRGGLEHGAADGVPGRPPWSSSQSSRCAG